MGMQEYPDGSMGDPDADFEKMLSESNKPDVKATHFGGLDELQKLKEDVESRNFTQQDFRNEQLNRIEGMLTSVILHFNVPHKGILTLPNTSIPTE